MSDEQPGGWPRPEDPRAPSTPVPPGWAPQQPPAQGPAYGWQQQGWQAPAPAAAPGYGVSPGFPPPPPPPPKPGIVPLRPLGVGEILDGAIAAMRTHWRIMLGLSAVVAAVTQLLTIPLTWALLHDAGQTDFGFSGTSSAEADLTVAASTITSALVQGLVTVIAVIVLTGVLTAAVSQAVLGRPISTREAWAQARPRIPALLGVTGLIVLISLGLLVACLAPGVVLALTDAPGIATGSALAVGGLVLVVAVVYVYTAFALAPPAIVLERQRVVASLRRSRSLVAGAWWRTFGILLLVNVIAQVLSGILGTPFSLAAVGLATVGGGDGNIFTLGPLLVTSVGTILAAMVTWPFTAVATALLYVDRRMRREALDLELVRAAGLAGPGGSGADPATDRPLPYS